MLKDENINSHLSFKETCGASDNIKSKFATKTTKKVNFFGLKRMGVKVRVLQREVGGAKVK